MQSNYDSYAKYEMDKCSRRGLFGSKEIIYKSSLEILIEEKIKIYLTS